MASLSKKPRVGVSRVPAPNVGALLHDLPEACGDMRCGLISVEAK
jgi:hypothetical protein